MAQTTDTFEAEDRSVKPESPVIPLAERARLLTPDETPPTPEATLTDWASI